MRCTVATLQALVQEYLTSVLYHGTVTVGIPASQIKIFPMAAPCRLVMTAHLDAAMNPSSVNETKPIFPKLAMALPASAL